MLAVAEVALARRAEHVERDAVRVVDGDAHRAEPRLTALRVGPVEALRPWRASLPRAAPHVGHWPRALRLAARASARFLSRTAIQCSRFWIWP